MEAPIIIYSASAGSGKTFSLTVRYIALLLRHGVGEFAHTLAVTFTNKATAEMKTRILEQLYGISHSLPDSEAYLDNVLQLLGEEYGCSMSAEKARERCADALHTILHDYSRFNVMTIDRFFQVVLRNMAHELGLNAHLTVDISEDEIKDAAVEGLLERLTPEDKELRRWLEGYIMEQINDGKSWDVRGKLKDVAQNLFREKYMRRQLDRDVNKPFNTENVESLRSKLKEIKEKKVNSCVNPAENFEAIMRDEGVTYDRFSNGPNRLKPFITKMLDGKVDGDYVPNQTTRGMASDPLNMIRSKERKDATLLRIAGMLSPALASLCDAFDEALPWVVSIDCIRKSLAPMGAMEAVRQEIADINHENNRFTLAHTNILLRRMISQDDAPFVFEKAGTRYRNVMIDEFQDTSALQWENFKTLLWNNQAEGGLSMVVGDIKQSIYRWRNGDWRTLQSLVQNKGNRVIQLDANRRSLSTIVSFNNRFFPKATEVLDRLGQERDMHIGALYNDVQQKPCKGDGGYVRISILKKEKETPQQDVQTVMLDDMLAQVKELNGQYGVPFNKMAIIIRYSRYIDPIVRHFAINAPDIRLVSNEAFFLHYSVGANMIVSALTWLDGEDANCDDVSLCFLRKQLWQEAHPGDTTADWAFASDKGTPLEVLANRREELKRMPLHELCEELYRLLGIDRMRDQDAYMLTFFDQLTAYANDFPTDIHSFLAHWEESMKDTTIPEGEVDGIRILTIHKAKGLEFHTVLMPYCDYSIERDEYKDYLWCLPTKAPLDELGSLPLAEEKALESSFFADDYKEEHVNKRIDELNGLYVGFTRAKENLLVWAIRSIKSDGVDNSTVGALIAQCLDLEDGTLIEGAPTPYIYKEQQGNDENKISPSYKPETVEMCSYPGRFEFRQSKPAREFTGGDGDSSHYIQRGKVLHYVFSQIATANDIPKALRDIRSRGIVATEEQASEVERLVRECLEVPLAKDWFSGRYRLHNECTILCPAQGKTEEKRPDRVMVGDDTVIVVDFKTGMSDPSHRRQVEEYVSLVSAMHPDKQAQGWLWYINDQQIERVI